MAMVMADLVVVAHRGTGWHSRTREHGNSNYGE
jgi:hypothetical protein